jgi:hypothetical protein
MMEALSSSETSNLTREKWRNIPEDGILLSASNLRGCKQRPARKAENLAAICDSTVYNIVGASKSRNPMSFHGLLHR